MKKFILLVATAITFLAGCNTVSGVGKDIKAGGSAVSGAAEEAKPY